MLASQSPELQAGDLCPATAMSSLLPCGLISMQVPVTPAKKSFCMGTHVSFINLVSPPDTGNSDQLKQETTRQQATAVDQPFQVTCGTHMMVDWSDLTAAGSSATSATGDSSKDEAMEMSECSKVSPCLALELERTIAELEQTFRQSDPRLRCMSPGSSFEEDYDVIAWADYGFGLAGSEADSIRLHQSCSGGYEASFDKPSHTSHVHGHYASTNSFCDITHVDLSSPETGIVLTDPCSDHDSWGSPESSAEWRWRQSGSDVDDSSSGAGSSFDQVNLHPHLSSQRPPVSALLSSRSHSIPTPDFPLRDSRKRSRPCSLTETEDEAEEVLESYPTCPANYNSHPSGAAILPQELDPAYNEYSELERTSPVKHQPTVKPGSTTVKDRSMSPLTIPSKVLKPGRHSSLRLARRRTSTLYAGCFTLNKGKPAGTGTVVVDLAQDEVNMEVQGQGGVHGPQSINTLAVERVGSPGSLKGQRAGQGALGKERKKGSGRSSRGPCCSECGTQSTPVWRAGPCGPKTLCNACGVRFMKMGKKRGRELLASTTQ